MISKLDFGRWKLVIIVGNMKIKGRIDEQVGPTRATL